MICFRSKVCPFFDLQNYFVKCEKYPSGIRSTAIQTLQTSYHEFKIGTYFYFHHFNTV